MEQEKKTLFLKAEKKRSCKFLDTDWKLFDFALFSLSIGAVSLLASEIGDDNWRWAKQAIMCQYKNHYLFLKCLFFYTKAKTLKKIKFATGFLEVGLQFWISLPNPVINIKMWNLRFTGTFWTKE